jgi:CRP-like cAMP-binding protein
MDEPLLESLEPFASELTLARGQVVVWEGHRQEAFYVVLDGKLVVTQRIRGDLESLLAELGPGASFGELAVLCDTPAAATVTAEEKTRVWKVDRAALDRLVGEPDVCWAMLKSLAGKVRMANARLAEAVRWSLDASGAQRGRG